MTHPSPAPCPSTLPAGPQGLAQWLAIIGSDIPGFDNGDRHVLRRIAMALAAPDGLPLARRMVAHAVGSSRTATGAPAFGDARPERALLAAVHYLLRDGLPPADVGFD